MRRRLGIAAALVASCALAASAQEPPPQRPNFVLLVADDLGWNDIGYHGSKVATPRLDALARESVVLDRFYAYSNCSPTRAMLLTGRNPSRFGIRGPTGTLPLEAVTIPELLARQGYRSGLVGKWHLGSTFELGPRRQGFDFAHGYLHGQVDPRTHRSWDLGPNWYRDEAWLEEPGHATDLIAQGAIDFLRREAGGPFFLVVSFSVPHYPLQEDARWVAPYEGVFEHPDRRVYAASVTHMDDAIGRILETLDALGLRERTLVFFLSDNGAQRDWKDSAYGGAHGPYAQLGDNAPLRGWKDEPYDGGLRVPAFVHWRGRLEPRTVGDVTSAADVLPTVARLAGVTPPGALGIDGVDLGPLLAGTGALGPRTLYWNARLDAKVGVLLEGDWKLIEDENEGRTELFDVREDPGETRDRAAELPERVDAMRRKLAEIRAADPQP